MLESIWFVLWGLLWAIYFMLDGFDLGAGALMPFLAKNEPERLKVYHAVEPYWDGNEVWLITAGGVTFAAFPGAYATLFSALYSPLMLILFALILRGSALALRVETEGATGRKLWDICFVVGKFLPMLLFGVAFANLLQGIPIDGEGRFNGTILTLLNPLGLLGGVLFVLLLSSHGALWVAFKSQGEVKERAAAAARLLRWPLLAFAVIFVALTIFNGQLLNKDAFNLVFPLIAVPAMVIPLLLTAWLSGKGQWLKAWTASSVAIVTITMTLVLAMFPALVPAIDPAFSKTVTNSASSPLTLKIMLGVVVVFLPIVIGYQTWAYLLFNNKKTG